MISNGVDAATINSLSDTELQAIFNEAVAQKQAVQNTNTTSSNTTTNTDALICDSLLDNFFSGFPRLLWLYLLLLQLNRCTLFFRPGCIRLLKTQC